MPPVHISVHLSSHPCMLCMSYTVWISPHILWTLFHIELIYCGPFSILNLYIVDLFPYWTNKLWTLPYWTNVLWTLFCIELTYCGPFFILNGYIVDRNPYWTNILWTISILWTLLHIEVIHFLYCTNVLWTLFCIELIYCGPFSILN